MTEGFRTWLLQEEGDRQVMQHIKVALPGVRQQTNFDCGAAVLRAIASYYKVGPETECDFVKEVEADPKKGTRPVNIVAAAKKFGLKVHAKEHWTVAKLKEYLDKGRPVICNIQAWGTPKSYAKRDSGHYVVAIGYDDKRIYFEDPTLQNARGFLPIKEFDRRWKDKETDAVHTDHLGIAIWKVKGDSEWDSSYVLKSQKIESWGSKP